MFEITRATVEVTKVVIAQPKSRSLRTTVPASIARQFGITENTELGWEIQARGNVLQIVIVPIEREPRERAGRAPRK